ncbi:MAG: DegT/DnrJ/EryC1/StrS family aminotransferase [Candidatus Staskawiczbacteria bacterium]|nr:DegT/DnrJ/EryC1/StrS family aminotransferase [Candidatus Staskawiczbacteria bacterium]
MKFEKNNHKLAIHGGPKIRTKLFPFYQTIGQEEIKAVSSVLKTGVLSKYLGAWHEDFYGGPEVRRLEKEWAKYFGVKHAISVNSATSGLYCAVGACGLGPGDEVIVSPYSMCISASAPLVYNAIPVFADIEKDFFCIDPESVESKITERTKAIIAVDIFGQPYDADKINAIAKKHNLYVIEDAAQAPGAEYKGRMAGTLGDIGVYSLNYHKHIHTGEGGMVVTDNDELAEKVRLIRNHAEAVVGDKGYSSLVNMIGFNFRMTEVEAAIARVQLKKLDKLLEARLKNVEYLSEKFSKFPFLEPAKVRPQCKHVFYKHPLKYKEEVVGVSRNKFIEAVKAELMPMESRENQGVLIGCGYVKPLYLLPLYQKLIGFGDKGCPFKCSFYKGKLDYSEGLCPVTEKMHNKELITHDLMTPPFKKKDLDDLISAFGKVYDNISELKK